MLTAIDENGKYIHLAISLDQSIIQSWRKEKQFYCPQCNERLLIKAGKIRITHFSHFKQSDCQLAFAEAESERHLQGKIDLYHLFKRQKIHVSLEAYIPKIKQRPDLLINRAGMQYAIEFQCSPISSEMILKRTEGYLNAGIIPIWIYGGPCLSKRQDSVYRLSLFQLSFATYQSSNLVLFSYDPSQKTFNLLTQMTKLTSNSFYAHHYSIPLQKFSIPFQLKQKAFALKNDDWLQNKRQWIVKRIRYGNLVNDFFLKTVYEKGQHPSTLPYICGLPLKYMEIFKAHPLEWQYFIYTVGLCRLKRGNKISLKYIKHKIQNAFKANQLMLQPFPLVQYNYWEQAVQEYFLLLTRLGYFEEVSADLFVLRKELSHTQPFEKRMSEEIQIYKNEPPFLQRESTMIQFFH